MVGRGEGEVNTCSRYVSKMQRLLEGLEDTAPNNDDDIENVALVMCGMLVRLCFLVLHEADRLLGKAFGDEMHELLSLI